MPPRPLWPIIRRMPLTYSFHDGGLCLTWSQTVRLHWLANLRMLQLLAPTVIFVAVSLVPLALWVGLSVVIAKLLPLETTSWTLLHDRFLEAMTLGLIPYLLVQHIAFMVAIESTYAPIVREVLGDMGMPVCSACGYSLRNREQLGRCPECGAGM